MDNKQLLSNDTCRCMSPRCKVSEECLRFTDKSSGERVPYSNFLVSLVEVCPYKITLEQYNVR